LDGTQEKNSIRSPSTCGSKPDGINMKKINVGVIGLGNMGYLHLMNCLHIDDVNVVAVSDKSKRALKKAESVGRV